MGPERTGTPFRSFLDDRIQGRIKAQANKAMA